MTEQPKYPSRTPEAYRLQKRKQRQREAEFMKKVNERLAELGIDHEQLLKMIVEGKVNIEVKENRQCTN